MCNVDRGVNVELDCVQNHQPTHCIAHPPHEVDRGDMGGMLEFDPFGLMLNYGHDM